MKPTTAFRNSLTKNRLGLITFIFLSVATAMVLATVPHQKLIKLPPVMQTSGHVAITTNLSQTKLVKGNDTVVYLDVSIKPPKMEVAAVPNRATDFIVVLDRSGSMSETNKMDFAKAAIHDLLSRLQNNDRFALVSFSDQAMIHSPLVAVNTDNRGNLDALVKTIQPAGGTNIGEGLTQAVQLLGDKRANSATKVLLLSDGHANQGIIDLQGLSQIVGQVTRKESVLSSIGMGLDFNETLMSGLADYGMGSYAYLENLSGLGEIFARSLDATRAIFAASSTMTVNVADGVELTDAGGYPMTKQGDTYQITTGQLLNNSDKKFTMTFQVKAQKAGDLALGNMLLAYQVQGSAFQQAVEPKQLTLAIVEPEHQQEAVASINRDVYQQSWLKNNLGVMQKKLSHWVREGDKAKADQAINEYRQEVAKAEKQANMPMASPVLEKEITALQSSVADAFSGDMKDQEVKRKRAAKSFQLGGIKTQRAESH